MEVHFESIEMSVLASDSETSVPVPRSDAIDIVSKRPKTVDLPRGPHRGHSFAERWSFSNRRSHLRSTGSSDDDSSTASNTSSQAVIRPFSGEDSDRCVEDFVGDIDSECRRLGWNGSTVLEKAKSLLSGKAATLLVTGNFVSWDGLREELVHEFGHRDTLRHCVRLPGENVTGFRLRIAEIAEREAMRVLMKGLRPEIARAVEDFQPTTLVDVASLAVYLESEGADTEMPMFEEARGLSSPALQVSLLINGHHGFQPGGNFQVTC